ncbi:hypothetical protein VTN02DRAFT_1600 [Thermoascus thermophilus]
MLRPAGNRRRRLSREIRVYAPRRSELLEPSQSYQDLDSCGQSVALLSVEWRAVLRAVAGADGRKSTPRTLLSHLLHATSTTPSTLTSPPPSLPTPCRPASSVNSYPLPVMSSLLGANYDSSSDDESKSKAAAPTTTATKVVAAPEVNVEVWSLSLSSLPIFCRLCRYQEGRWSVGQ